MELITKGKFVSLVNNLGKFSWNKLYGFKFETFISPENSYISYIYLSIGNVPLVYFSDLGLLYPDTVSNINSLLDNRITVDNWRLELVSSDNKYSYTIHEFNKNYLYTYFDKSTDSRVLFAEEEDHVQLEVGKYKIETENFLDTFELRNFRKYNLDRFFLGHDSFKKIEQTEEELYNVKLAYLVLYLKTKNNDIIKRSN